MREVPPVDSAEQAGADEGGMEHEVSHESRSKFALMNGMVENSQDGAWIIGKTNPVRSPVIAFHVARIENFRFDHFKCGTRTRSSLVEIKVVGIAGTC